MKAADIMDRWLIGAWLGCVVVGCVARPEDASECQVSPDCPAGEVCGEDGLCYGNPPKGPLAAELHPPEDRDDLARAEVVMLNITHGGDVTVAFEPSAAITGRVVLAWSNEVSVAARMTFRRPSRIPGGPDYVVAVDSQPGRTGTEPSFRARLLPNWDNETFEVTIYPDNGAIASTPGTPTPAELTAPRRETVRITEDTSDLVFTLGAEEGQKQLYGRVVDANGSGIPGMRVRALGRFSADAAAETLSSQTRTGPNGSFAIWVPVEAEDLFDLVIDPPPDKTLPRILRRGIFLADPTPPWSTSADIGEVELPPHPIPQRYQVAVAGDGLAGGTEPAAGALVIAHAQLYADETTLVTHVTQATVGPEGNVQLELVPESEPGSGVRRYFCDVVTLAGSPLASVWDVPLDVGADDDTSDGEIRLPARVFVTGSVLDHRGVPQADVTVRAVPSPTFMHSLARMREAIGTTWPQAITDSKGVFALYADPKVAGLLVSYDFEMIPPAGSLLPRWSVDEVPSASSGMMTLGELRLPDASYARGPVLDEHGMPVAGVEIRVFEVSQPGAKSCEGGMSEDLTCYPPARLRALAKSDPNGSVRLVLPRGE